LVVKSEIRDVCQCCVPSARVSGDVAVDGSDPDGVGVLWLPRTDGEGEPRVGAELGDGAGDVGDPGGAVEGDGLNEGGGVTADGGEGNAAVVVGLGAPSEEVGLASVVVGRSATLPVDDAANTTAAKATSPASARIGTRPNRLPRGKRSRQFGQNPDTGVVT
jgi:hypothetical protein